MKFFAHAKKHGVTVLALCLVACIIPDLSASGTSLTPKKITDFSSLSGTWSSSAYYAENASSDNCLAISDIYIPASTAFTFEADISMQTGSAGALAFGVSADGSTYSCASLDKSSKLAHVFGQYGSFNQPLTSDQQAKSEFHLKVVLDSSLVLSYYLDDGLVGSLVTSDGIAGYLGLNTYQANVIFDNIAYQITDNYQPVIGMTGLNGSWSNQINGSNRSSEDCFAKSNITIPANTPFSYEADFTINDGVAGAIVFGMASDNSSRCCLGIDKNAKIVHTFGGGLDYKSMTLTSDQLSQNVYHLKIVLDSSMVLTSYLDNITVSSLTLSSFSGGYLGLNTYYSNATFTNIQYSVSGGTSASVNSFTSLSGTWTSDKTSGSNHSSEDCYAKSDISIPANTPFSYEADVTINEGAAGAIVFGMASDNSSRCCLSIDRSSKIIHMFGGGLEYKSASLSDSQLAPSSYRLKIVLDSNMVLTAYLGTTACLTSNLTSFAGGYLGLNTYMSNASFSNIKYELMSTSGEAKTVTGITGFTGNWYQTETGSNRSSDNCIAISKVLVPANTPFTYEADVMMPDGLAASLVFGIGSDGSGLSAACVDKSSKLAHVFGQYGSFNKALTDAQMTQASYHLKLEYTASKTLSYYLDDSLIGSLDNVSIGTGYFGLCTYYSISRFYNVQYTVGIDSSDNLTGITDWTTVSGTWAAVENGMHATNSGAGNCILRSNIDIPKDTSFVYEADVTVESGCAGALVFGYKGDNNWCAASYDISAKLAHVFGGYASFQKSLTDAQLAVPTHHLKLLLTGTNLSYYVDDSLIQTANIGSFEGGYLGLNTYYSNVTFKNVGYSIIEAPTLTGLSFAEGSFREKFDSARTSYTATVDSDITSISLKATTKSDTLIQINGNIAESGSPFTVPLSDGDNTITVQLTDTNGFENTMNIIVTKVDLFTQYKEAYRPQLHYTALKNWINDPNGLVYDASTGLYHLYYQYSHSVSAGIRTSWGHATSTDLMHWTEMPVAITPDSLGLIWSGSCVIDKYNTSGFFDESTDPDSRIVAIYSYDTQNQAIAYSTDGGVTFTKYEGNPVIRNTNRMYSEHFRDPKVTWIDDDSYENGGIWLMVTCSVPCKLFTSPDLINWTYNSDLELADGTDIAFECPDLFPLALDDDENNTKWVMSCGGLKYVIGDLVKENGVFTFAAETSFISPVNGGNIVYASQTYYNDPQGRRILISWLKDSSASLFADKVWNGAQSIPCEVKLITVNGEMRITTSPVSEFNELRSNTPVFDISNITVNESTSNILDGVKGKIFDLEAVIDMGSAQGFSFNVRVGEKEYTTVSYDVASKTLNLNNNNSGSYRNTGITAMKLYPMDGNKVKIRIILDNSIVDVYGNDGEAAITSFIFPTEDGQALSFSANGGTVTVDSMKIYQLSSVWNNEYDTSIAVPAVLPTSTSTTSTEVSTTGISTETGSTSSPDVSATGSTSNQSPENSSPVTGHSNHLLFAICLFLLSLTVGFILKKYKPIRA